MNVYACCHLAAKQQYPSLKCFWGENCSQQSTRVVCSKNLATEGPNRPFVVTLKIVRKIFSWYINRNVVMVTSSTLNLNPKIFLSVDPTFFSQTAETSVGRELYGSLKNISVLRHAK